MSFTGSKPRKMNFNSLLQIQKDIFKREGGDDFPEGPSLARNSISKAQHSDF